MRVRRTVLFPILVSSLVATMIAAPAPATAQTRIERWRGKLLSFVNDYRAEHGVRRLRENETLSRKAQWHSVRMARRRQLFHTRDLKSKVRAWDPTMWGENIGKADSIWRVYKMWIWSSGHRANLLKRGYRRTGIGIVRARGYYWITMIFYG